MTPIEFFHAAARLHPQAVAAIELAADGRVSARISFAELGQRVSQAARQFRRLSGTARPRVVLASHNSLAMLVCILAVYETNGVLVPLTPGNPEAELRQQIEVARPDLVIVDRTARALRDGQNVPVVVLDADFNADAGTGSGEGTSDRPDPAPEEADGGDLMAIKFTGGSSGRPKAVLQSVRCLNTMIASLLQVFRFGADERFLVSPPMTHGAGTFVLPVLAAGGCLVIVDGARAASLLDALASQRVTSTWVPPTLLYQLIDQQMAQPRALPALRQLLYGGAGATMERLLQARRLFGPVIGVTYGLTEAPVIIAGMHGQDSADDANLGSAGRAGPLTRLAIMGADGLLVGTGETGEVVARGDLLMSGYLDMPAETRAALADDWLRTGDIGHLDARGFLFIKGRSKDVIISGGFNVHPADVEEALARHEAVAESVVFGVPDAHWGERVEAVVELKAGSQVDGEALRAFVREALGGVRTPKTIHLIERLPRNPLGKVQKRELRSDFIRRFGQR